MAATITTSGANRTIVFTYTGPAAVIDAIADGAAHRLATVAHLGPDKVYTTWSVSEKLAVLDTFVKADLTNLAKEDSVTTSVEAARAAAQAAADTNLSIGG